MSAVDHVLQNIITSRKQKGLSQEYMAQQLGVNASNYSKLERGETRITVERLFQIARVLSVEVERLLYGTSGYAQMADKAPGHLAALERDEGYRDLAHQKELLKQRVEFLEKMNEQLSTQLRYVEHQLKDKEEIIELLKKGGAP